MRARTNHGGRAPSARVEISPLPAADGHPRYCEFAPPDANTVYRNYLETWRGAGVTPVSREHALGLMAGRGATLPPTPTRLARRGVEAHHFSLPSAMARTTHADAGRCWCPAQGLVGRAAAIGRQPANARIQAAVYRVAWSLPLRLVIGSAVVVIVLLVLFG